MQKALRVSFPVLLSVLAFGAAAPVAFAATPGDVVINEFVSNPSSGSDWVELYNASTSPVNLTGWTLKDLANTPHSTTTTMAPGGFLVFSVGTNLNNGGDVIYLTDNNSATSSAVAYGSAATSTVDYEYVPMSAVGQSVYRTTDGGATWALTSSPTKGVTNVIPAQIGITSGSLTDLTNALGAVVSGGIVTLSGSYTGDITISRPLTLRAATGATPVLTGSITITSDNVTVDGLTITNPAIGYGIVATDHSHLHITNNTVHDIGTTLASGSAQAIYVKSGASAVTDITISGNHITNVGNTNLVYGGSGSAKGIFVGDSNGVMDFDGVTISNNIITNIATSGSVYPIGRGAYGILVNHSTSAPATRNLSVSGNTISNLNGRWSHAIGLEGNTPNAVLSNNTITGLSNGGSGSAALWLEDNVSGSTVTGTGNTWDSKPIVLAGTSIVVDPSVSSFTSKLHPEVLLNGSYHYAGVNAFSKIQEAITTASPSNTITIAAGHYPEQLTISKSLTLVGSGSGNTFVVAPSTLVADISGAKSIITISGSGVIVDLSHVTVSGPGPSGCGSITAGIFVRDGAAANIHDNSVSDIRDEPFSGCQNGVGIFVGRNLYSTTGTATIANNTITGYQKGGIVVDNAGSGATISGNTVTGIGATGTIAQNGIQISRGATATVTANQISGNSYTSTGLNASSPPVSEALCTGDGTGLSATDKATFYNDCWASAGLLLYNHGSGVVASGNTIANNQLGSDISGSQGAALNGNKFINSALYGIHAEAALVDATGSYWGSGTGPASGSIVGNISTTPWYTDALLTTLTTGTPTQSGGQASTTLPVAVTQTGTSNGVTVTAVIPANTVITGDVSWNGLLSAPTATTASIAIPGYSTTVTSAVAIGSSGTDLSFDKAVKLTFAGQAGKRIGWYDHAGAFSEITTACTGTNDEPTQTTNLATNSACKISDDGAGNLVVWTKHFSTFTTYSSTVATPVISPNGAVFHGFVNVTMDDSTAPAAIRYSIDGTDPICGGNLGYANGQVLTFSNSTTLKAIRCDGVSSSAIASAIFNPAGGNGGGGGGAISATPATPATPAVPTVSPATPATPATPAARGRVLGAEAYNFTKDLHMGSTGADVTELQKLLIASGFDIPAITKGGMAYGTFGGQTLSAVIAYQKAHGVSPARGYVSTLTRAELNKGNATTTPATGKTNLTASQANSILSLLQSFGAETAVVAKVKAALGQ